MYVVQSEGACLHTAGFVSFVSLPQIWHTGWRSFRVDAMLNSIRNLRSAGAAVRRWML